MKNPSEFGLGDQVVNTLGTKQHRALIALLIEKREAAGLTQAALAKRLGEHQSLIARIESGQRRIVLVEFLNLAEALAFDPALALRDMKECGAPKR